MADSRRCFIKDCYITEEQCCTQQAKGIEACEGCDWLDKDTTDIVNTPEKKEGVKMGNQLIDLNDHLFSQLKRLTASGLEGGALAEEIERSRAMGGIAKNIIDNAKLALDAHKSLGETKKTLPSMIGDADGT